MNFRFWRKPKPTLTPLSSKQFKALCSELKQLLDAQGPQAIRRIPIPAEEVLPLHQMLDSYNELPCGQDRAAHYRLWAHIGKLVPETLEGHWTIEFPSALTAEAVEYPEQ